MTAQFCERLIFDGKETKMACTPPLPNGHPRIVTMEREKTSENLAEAIAEAIFYSTACWRNYIGTWQIKGERFYLVDLRGKFRLQGDVPLLADWFSGVLRIPRGRMLAYVHMGFGSVYEEDLYINIEQGKVMASWVIDNLEKHLDTLVPPRGNGPGARE